MSMHVPHYSSDVRGFDPTHRDYWRVHKTAGLTNSVSIHSNTFSYLLQSSKRTTMDTVSILSLNTRACCLMSANKYRDAGILLVSALRQIQQGQSVSCRSVSTVMTEHDKDLVLQPMRIGKDDHDCSSFSLYNWAILVMDHDVQATKTLKNEIKLSALLLYNTGLAYQAMGMEEGSEQVSFQMALKMYNIALSLLCTCDSSDRLLRLALLNNKGFIMSYFCEFDEAQACLAHIKFLLATIYAPEEAQREDILEIRMNVALLFGKHSHAAAA
ncbi:hypothetical protein MPSEU_000055500 [Mayamaea pseudoterrestris]|nr:hypothetical protein MPSEU_000055500 [Mayamaea pseudoterrestris]